MAEALALVAALFFALAATLQQKGALGTGEVSLGPPSSLLMLAKQTWWLLGTIALLGGYAFQAIALDHGRQAVGRGLLRDLRRGPVPRRTRDEGADGCAVRSRPVPVPAA